MLREANRKKCFKTLRKFWLGNQAVMMSIVIIVLSLAFDFSYKFFKLDFTLLNDNGLDKVLGTVATTRSNLLSEHCPIELLKRMEKCSNANLMPLAYFCDTHAGPNYGCGGLGDRFRGIIHLHHLSITDACVPYQLSTDLGGVWEFRNNNSKVEKDNYIWTKKNFYNPARWPINLTTETLGVVPYLIETNQNLKSSAGSDSNITVDNYKGCLWNYVFKLSGTMKTLLKEIRDEIDLKMRTNGLTKIIGIHLRVGDVVIRPGGQERRANITTDLPKLFDCADEFRREKFGEEKALYLFVSDSLTAKKMANKSSNVYITDIVPLHVDDWGEEHKRLQSSWLEILLLSKNSDALVMTSGGYAKIAVAIGFIPGTMIKMISKNYKSDFKGCGNFKN